MHKRIRSQSRKTPFLENLAERVVSLFRYRETRANAAKIRSHIDSAESRMTAVLVCVPVVEIIGANAAKIRPHKESAEQRLTAVFSLNPRGSGRGAFSVSHNDHRHVARRVARPLIPHAGMSAHGVK